MNREIKILSYHVTKLKNAEIELNKFLNQNEIGEVYDIIVTISNSGSYANNVYFTIFYEKIDNENRVKTITQKKINKLSKEQSRPKLL